MVRLDQKNEWRDAFYMWRSRALYPDNFPLETLLDDAEKYFTKFHEAFDIAQSIQDLHDTLSQSIIEKEDI